MDRWSKAMKIDNTLAKISQTNEMGKPFRGGRAFPAGLTARSLIFRCTEPVLMRATFGVSVHILYISCTYPVHF